MNNRLIDRLLDAILISLFIPTLYVIYIKKKNENRTCSYMTKNLLLKKETSA